jgi:hypothetical protein
MKYCSNVEYYATPIYRRFAGKAADLPCPQNGDFFNRFLVEFF